MPFFHRCNPLICWQFLLPLLLLPRHITQAVISCWKDPGLCTCRWLPVLNPPCQEDANKPHADLGLWVKQGGWDLALWFRVGGCWWENFARFQPALHLFLPPPLPENSFFFPKDGSKLVHCVCSLWMPHDCLCSWMLPGKEEF